jgi:hypothetical protein
MSLTEKQLASLNRSARRAVARRGDGDQKLSLYIRVAESRIYNGKLLHKALLKEVIFMRLHDLHDGDLRIPKFTPWSKDYRKYEGWCYASQEYLANRAGCVRETANRVLKQIVKDGYLKVRKWRGKNGSWHKQYSPDEFAIDAAIAKLGSASDDNPDGTPSDRRSHTLVTVDHVPSDSRSLGHVTLSPNPSDPRSQQEVSGKFLEVGVGSTTFSTPPSASPSGGLAAATLSNQEKTKPTPPGLGADEAKKEKGNPNPGRVERFVPGADGLIPFCQQDNGRKCYSGGRWLVDGVHTCFSHLPPLAKAAAASGSGFDIEEA